MVNIFKMNQWQTPVLKEDMFSKKSRNLVRSLTYLFFNKMSMYWFCFYIFQTFRKGRFKKDSRYPKQMAGEKIFLQWRQWVFLNKCHIVVELHLWDLKVSYYCISLKIFYHLIWSQINLQMLVLDMF